MRHLLACLLLMLLSGCSSMPGWLPGGGSSSDIELPDPPDIESQFRPKKIWVEGVGSGTGDQRLNLRPALDGTRIFVADYKGRVSALETPSGKTVWKVKTGAAIAAGPGIGNGLVVVGTSNGEVIALERADGTVRWRVTVSSEVLSVPRIENGVVVVQTVDGDLAGLDSAKGERLWIYDRTVPVLTLRGTSSPAIAHDAAIAGFASGKVAAIAVASGRLLWESQVAVPRGRSELERLVDVDGDPVIRDDVIYVSTYPGQIAALDLQSGQVIWTRKITSVATPGVDTSLVFASDSEGQVWALSRRQGASVWRQDGLKGRGPEAPVPFGNYVVVGDVEGYLYFLGRSDGALAASLRVDSSGFSAPPVVAGDTLYVLGRSGRLMALQVP